MPRRTITRGMSGARLEGPAGQVSTKLGEITTNPEAPAERVRAATTTPLPLVRSLVRQVGWLDNCKMFNSAVFKCLFSFFLKNKI